MKRGLKVVSIITGTICLASMLFLGCIYLEDLATYAKALKNRISAKEE